MTLTLALVTAAVGIGSMHTLAPDHWVPFAALARAERWSTWRTMLITALCGLGHVTVSVVLGLTSALFGLELLETFGRRLESVAGFLLISFGVAYGLWGVHRSVRARWHDHGDVHPHWHGGHGHHPIANHVHADPHEGRLTAWTLFLLFSADPCVAVIPLMFLAAPLGWPSTLAVVASYELATIGTMVVLVLPARAAATAVRGQWADLYGDALAGGVIAALGIAVVGLGL
jgi:ABC-type nickel/cobalt efflux system permease component RcnA